MDTQLKPDTNSILSHLETIFGDQMTGLVELSWTDPFGPLKHAQLFELDNLDSMAEKAESLNQTEGVNVYYGQALRSPNCAPFGRTSDSDVIALTAVYCDLDDAGAAEAARAIYTAIGIKPTSIVITGEHPHVRAQMHYRLLEAITDHAQMRNINSAICRTFSGDPTVVNPSRVLRLPGTIAWPHKKGRVAEMTQLIDSFPDNRPKSLAIEHIERVFSESSDGGPSLPFQSAAPDSGVQTLPPSLSGPTPPNRLVAGVEGQEYWLERIKAGDHWHNNMIKLVGSMMAQGIADDVILSLAPTITLPGYALPDTLREMGVAIQGGRKKGFTEGVSPSGTPEQLIPEGDLIATPLRKFDPATIPPRPWIVSGLLLKGKVSVIIAPPGVGKSTLTIQIGIAICTDKDFGTLVIKDQGKVWLYNNEDDQEELERRVAAAAIHVGMQASDLTDVMFVNSGENRELLIAREDPNTSYVIPVDVDAVVEQIKANNIKVLVVDPFAETHTVNENSNDHIKQVGRMYRQIAQRGDCAVLLVHHTRKPSQAAGDTHIGNMDSGRGAGALSGVARVVTTLYGMTEKDADRFGIPAEERNLYIRMDDAKANLSLVSNEARWFKRTSENLGNGPIGAGDEVGVLSPVDLSSNEQKAKKQKADEESQMMFDVLQVVRTEPATPNYIAGIMAKGDVYTTSSGTNLKANAVANRIVTSLTYGSIRVGDWVINMEIFPDGKKKYRVFAEEKKL